jgi:hypothetical protein
VVCDLSLHSFDDPGVGHARAHDACAEVRRLGRFDDRVRNTRIRCTGPLDVQVEWTVRAAGPSEALELCSVILRSALHAAGNSTAGWELIHPRVQLGSRHRRRRSAATAAHRPTVGMPDWAALSAAAQQRMALVPALPPLAAAGSGDTLIDLR